MSLLIPPRGWCHLSLPGVWPDPPFMKANDFGWATQASRQDSLLLFYQLFNLSIFFCRVTVHCEVILHWGSRMKNKSANFKEPLSCSRTFPPRCLQRLQEHVKLDTVFEKGAHCALWNWLVGRITSDMLNGSQIHLCFTAPCRRDGGTVFTASWERDRGERGRIHIKIWNRKLGWDRLNSTAWRS